MKGWMIIAALLAPCAPARAQSPKDVLPPGARLLGGPVAIEQELPKSYSEPDYVHTGIAIRFARAEQPTPSTKQSFGGIDSGDVSVLAAPLLNTKLPACHKALAT